MNAAVTAVHSQARPVERVFAAEHYRAEIDGLRGVAVLAVVAFHAFPDYFPGGFVGVDVFFVISGFLISGIILRQLGRSSFTLRDFYARRIRRIFPALIIVVLASLAFGAYALLPRELEELGKHTAAAATFVSNFVLWRESGYFAGDAELKPFLHLWSLGIEEQFYLVWPVLLILLWRRQRNSIAANVLLLTVASFALSLALAERSSVASFYFPVSRFWELGLGCLLAVIRESPGSSEYWLHRSRGLRQLTASLRAHSVLPALGLALIAAAVFLFDGQTAFPGWAALVPTVGAAFVISARASSWFQRRVMASSGLVLAGLISYPLYLWHWPLLSFATILNAGAPPAVTRAIAVALSVVLAWLTYKYLEKPIRQRRSGRAAIALAAILALLGVAGVATYAAAGFPHRFDVDVRSLQGEPRRNAFCPSRFAAADEFNYCKSTSAAPPEAVFIGDSRAQAVYDAVVSLLGTDQPIALLGRGGCTPLLNIRERGECDAAWDAFVDYVGEVKPALIVVIGGGAPLFQQLGEGEPPPAIYSERRRDALRYGLRDLIAALQKTSRVIYVRRLPSYSSSPACFLRPISFPGARCIPTIPRSKMEAELSVYNSIVDEVARGAPDLDVIDSIPVVCDANVCSQRLKWGEIIYSDEIHLSPAGSRYFAQKSGLAEMIAGELAVSKSRRDQRDQEDSAGRSLSIP